jgi:hypothetical protein
VPDKEKLLKHLRARMTGVSDAMEELGFADWKIYLVVRKPGEPESFSVLKLPLDESDFSQRLERLHVEHTAREQ